MHCREYSRSRHWRRSNRGARSARACYNEHESEEGYSLLPPVNVDGGERDPHVHVGEVVHPETSLLQACGSPDLTSESGHELSDAIYRLEDLTLSRQVLIGGLFKTLLIVSHDYTLEAGSRVRSWFMEAWNLLRWSDVKRW